MTPKKVAGTQQVSIPFVLQDALSNNTVQISQVVANMRRDRGQMVQNKDQYICIHNALLAFHQDHYTNY